MQSQTFTGLPMPVFTAFGWTGEETAINFAFSQMELFINELHPELNHELRAYLPFSGLSRQSKSVYLSSTRNPEADMHISFLFRPMSLEIQLAITDKATLQRALRKAEKNVDKLQQIISQLDNIGEEWNLRIQQMQYDDGNATSYQEIFRDSVTAFTPEVAQKAISRATFLNKEAQWITPIYLSLRLSSEQVAAMMQSVTLVMNQHLVKILPIIKILSDARIVAPKSTAATGGNNASPTSKKAPKLQIEPIEQFEFVAQLKPLHIRRGFINLTQEHWAFFALSARVETRPVAIYYDNHVDKESSVWHLVTNNQARIMLGRGAHLWVENNFNANDRIKIIAKKINAKDIRIELSKTP